MLEYKYGKYNLPPFDTFIEYLKDPKFIQHLKAIYPN
jgi:hypothetical protein